jgi:subtilisin-like proprotein convertase family protein
MKSSHFAAAATVLACAAGLANAQSFVQSFDDITNLPGWFTQNNSSPLGTINWFQGNPAAIPLFATAGYIGANFNNTSGAGTISNWLLTPAVTISNGDQLRFWTRRPDVTEWADRLEIRMSSAGASTNVGTGALAVGDFTNVLLTINPNLVWQEYPGEWTAFTVTVSGLGAPVSGRFAFRYFVENGGPSGLHSDYIGIDEVQFGVGGIATGACEFNSAPCQVISAHECTVLGGTYQGTGSVCAPPAEGACCLADGTCTVDSKPDCIAAAGVYQGDGTTCGNCPTNYAYTGGTLVVPDGLGADVCGDPAVAAVTVQDNFTVGAVHVALHVQHTWQGDVKITLRHIPSNTAVVIVDRPGKLAGVSTFGFAEDDFGTFTTPFRSTETALSLYNRPDRTVGLQPATGSWRPDNALAAFNGVNSAGEWRLEVQDCFDGDTGFLHGFTLSLEPQSGPACYANCDGSTTAPVLNVDDFTCFINSYAAAQALPTAQQITAYANCDGSTTSPVLNVDDFTCFINQYAQGCP